MNPGCPGPSCSAIDDNHPEPSAIYAIGNRMLRGHGATTTGIVPAPLSFSARVEGCVSMMRSPSWRRSYSRGTWRRDNSISTMKAKTRQPANGTAGEQTQHPKQTDVLAAKNLLPNGGIDARQRNKGPNSV